MEQYTSYQALIESFPLAECRVGILKPGRYTGFDQITEGAPGANINIVLGHSGNTLPYVGKNNSPGTSQGAVISNQGVVIKGSDTFNLTLNLNPSLPTRLDILYLQYDWADLVGGGDIYVGVIEGTVNNTLPALTFPATQIILGVITVPQDAEFADLIYTPTPVPLLGGVNIVDNFPELSGVFARLASPNKFTATQAYGVSSKSLTIDGDGHIILDSLANTYILTGNLSTNYSINGFLPNSTGGEFETGTKIRVWLKSIGSLSIFQHNSITPLGYTLDLSLFEPDIEDGQSLVVPSNYLWEFELMPSKKWALINTMTFTNQRLNDSINRLVILESLMNSSGWVRVPESSDSASYKFNTYFSSSNWPDDGAALRYRKGLKNSLEITGGFKVAVLPEHSGERVFTLPTGFQPSVPTYFKAVVTNGSFPSAGIPVTSYDGLILTNGGVYINFPGSFPVVNTELSINIVIPK